MYNTYFNCRNLTGNPVCGDNVTNMGYTYYNCYNLTGDAIYFYSNKINNVRNCFYGKNNSRQYNIHVPANSTTLTTCLISNTSSLVGATITYTNNGTCYYNTAYNIYIYPDL
jgi:hypothetical protein